MIKYLVLLLVTPLIFTDTFSQKVKRKGVRPIPLHKKFIKPLYTLEDFQGKWQEVRRSSPGDSQPLEFQDSLQMEIVHDTAIVRDGVHFTMMGAVYLDNPVKANIAGELYSILELSKDSMALSAGRYVHEFHKLYSFYYESFGKDSVNVESFENGIQPMLEKLKGKWVVYRREAHPGTAFDNDLIRYLDITTINADNSMTGEVRYYNRETSNTLACSILIRDSEMQVISENNTWIVTIYKADGDELIFGNKTGVINYCKRI